MIKVKNMQNLLIIHDKKIWKKMLKYQNIHVDYIYIIILMKMQKFFKFNHNKNFSLTSSLNKSLFKVAN